MTGSLIYVPTAPGDGLHVARQISARFARTICGLRLVRRDEWTGRVGSGPSRTGCGTCKRLQLLRNPAS